MLMKIPQMRSDDQSGMASFLIVSVIVVLITLVSLGFAQLADREERQALDRQLSDEAYYAAESGLNDAYAYLTTTSNPQSTQSCNVPSGGVFATNGNVDGDGSGSGVIRYSCLLIDTQPKELVYPVQAGQAVSFPISVSNLSNLYLSWQNSDAPLSGTRQPLTNTFKQLPQENSDPGNLGQDATGLLQVSIYPVRPNADSPPPNQTTNTILAGDARTYFLYPNSGNGKIDSNSTASYSSNGIFVSGNCNNNAQPALPDPTAPLYCNSEITNIPPGDDIYYVTLTAKYKALTVSVQASGNGPGNNLLLIPGVQAKVDSTGAGNDVLRRVQARVPLQLNLPPVYGLQSMQAVCKLFRVPVQQQGVYGTPQIDGASPNQDPNGLCSPPNFTTGIINGEIIELRQSGILRTSMLH